MWKLALGLAITSATGTGCMGYAAVRGSASDVIDGAAVGYEGPVSRLRVGLEAGYERLPTASGERRGVAGYDATLRLGVISTVLDGRCSELCLVKPWVDFGPVLGAGVAVTGDLDRIGHGMGGGWLDVRLSGAPSYWVLRLELQHDAYSSRVDGTTQLVVALGFVDWNTRDD